MGYKTVHQPGSWVNDIPIFGGHFQKINHAIDLYANPCSPSAEIWVYGLFQAIPTLVASLKKPEIIDINIAHRHGKPRKAKRFNFIPDILLRDAIIEIPVPRWVVFRIYELSQRIGWYFLVADATEDFAINWMTTAYKYQGCNLPTIWYLRGESGPTTLCGGNAPGLGRIPYSPTIVSGISTGISEFSFIHPGSYRVGWTVSFTPYEVASVAALPSTTYLWDVGANKPVDVGELGFHGGPGSSGSGNVILNVDSTAGPFAFYGEWAEAGFARPHLQVSIDNVDDDALGPDP